MKNNYLLALLKIFRALMFITIMTLPSVSWAALNAYMTITIAGTNIQGEVTIPGREDTIEIVNFSYNVVASISQVTGQPSGSPQYKPVRILKNIDKTSPLLFKALIQNENVDIMTIRFYKPDPNGSGPDIQYYTIELLNAKVISVIPSHSASDNNAGREAVSFVFQTITVTDETSATVFSANWQGQ